ncbi:LysE family translocator [Pelagibacterium limicola]|uniref:LysE family translocator n=1 Tax=Pelagibacterium limicola TaxID=2791022 RepID=UPI0018B0053D|nr:LysE family transporter [Pelagibacterium limicola]
MVEWPLFLFAVLVLLATPGPTNTLVAAGGAGRGVAGAMPLLIGELAGYGLAITFWTEIVGAAASVQPSVLIVSKLAASAFLVWSSVKLWKIAGTDCLPGNGIAVRRVFLTTLLNPKALVLAFGIFPPVGFVSRLPYFAAFSVLVTVTAIGWMTFGALLRRSGMERLTLRGIDRIAAVVLTVFAVLVALSAIG